jgi:hypothetical protein
MVGPQDGTVDVVVAKAPAPDSRRERRAPCAVARTCGARTRRTAGNTKRS